MAPVVSLVVALAAFLATTNATEQRNRKLHVNINPYNSQRKADDQPEAREHLEEGHCQEWEKGFDSYNVLGLGSKSCIKAYNKACTFRAFSDHECKGAFSSVGNITWTIGRENEISFPGQKDAMAYSGKVECWERAPAWWSSLDVSRPLDFTDTLPCCGSTHSTHSMETTTQHVVVAALTPDPETVTQHTTHTANHTHIRTEVVSVATTATQTQTETEVEHHWFPVTETPAPVTVQPSFDYSISASTLSHTSSVESEPTTFSWMHMGATYTTTLPAQVETIVLDVYGPVVVEGTETSTHSTTTTTITLPAQQTNALRIE